MKNIYIIVVLLIAQMLAVHTFAQNLKPYFNKAEYRELLLISAKTNTPDNDTFDLPEPFHHKMIYRSAIVGLDNRWDLWINDTSSVAVISIRGTTKNSESWLSNFYAAMVPAKGKLTISENKTFEYELASNDRAAVHVGWLLSMAFLAEDIVPKIDSLYKTGTKNFLLMGHSQGGAIDYLLTAYLYNLQQKQQLPADIRFKTYCSAAPKPGNLYFAYHYESITQNGWAYNVVNSADWVPETPISIQTLNDFNYTNPFKDAKEKIKKLKFPKNIYLKKVYNNLDKPTKKAQKSYEKYLGKMTSKAIITELNGFVSPPYCSTNNYVRTGTTIVLFADDEYYKQFPDDDKKMWVHHFYKPYFYLLDKSKF